MLVLVCSSATCKPYAVPLLGKPHRREKPPLSPLPGNGSAPGRVRAEPSSPRGAPRGLPASAAPSTTGGDAPHRHPRLPPHFGTGVASPAGAAKSPFRAPTRSPCSPRPFVRGPEGPGVGSQSRAGRAGAAPVPQLDVEPVPAAVQGLLSAGAAVCRCCSDSCLFPSSFGSETTSQSPTQIP